jgi:hypothetical protein
MVQVYTYHRCKENRYFQYTIHFFLIISFFSLSRSSPNPVFTNFSLVRSDHSKFILSLMTCGLFALAVYARKILETCLHAGATTDVIEVGLILYKQTNGYLLSI